MNKTIRPDAPTDLECKIWTLSWVSNVNAGIVGTQNELANNLSKIQQFLDDPTVQESMGAWEIVWGPEIVNKGIIPGRRQTANCMFVARQGQDYVVAIAGTNIVSHYGWFDEDFMVDEMVPWSTIEPGGEGSISKGASDGLKLLRDMKSKGVTLENYIQGLDAGQVFVAGHSLGGALAPLVALILRTAAQAGVVVGTNPTAGPTSGNVAFATYASETLGANYISWINTLDVVPHAWQADLVAMIPGLYADASVATCTCNASCGETSSTSTGIQPNDIIHGIGYWIASQPSRPNLYHRIGTDNTFVGDSSGMIGTCEVLGKGAEMIFNLPIAGIIKVHLQTIMRYWSGKHDEDITCQEILTFLQFFAEFADQHTTQYINMFVWKDVQGCAKTLNTFVNPAILPLVHILSEFMGAVAKYMKENPPS